MVNAALNGYFHDLYERLMAQMTAEVRAHGSAIACAQGGILFHVRAAQGDADNAGVENMGSEIAFTCRLLVRRGEGLSGPWQ